jgi:hypothetical protein
MTNTKLTGQALQDEIVATINNIETPGNWVRITKFIGQLDATRDDIEREFIALANAEVIVLVAAANTKVLTDQDRRDAIRVGSEDKHLVAVQPSW